jgi:lysophospholipase L1-like esterase
MRSVLVFGDSNSWGSNPSDGSRFPPGVRWPTVMLEALGPGWYLVEEGLRGRTTVFDDPIEGGRRGIDYLGPCLLTHEPIDVVVLALGTNDLKLRFSASPEDIARGVERLILAIRASRTGPDATPPRILLMVPPPLADSTLASDVWSGSRDKSLRLAERYAAIASLHGVPMIDAGAHIRTSEIDGIHWEADQHLILGQAMAPAVTALFG